MKRSLVVATLAVAALSTGLAPAGGAADAPGTRVLAHDVYFALKDASPKAQEALVEACRRHLTGHEGTVFFATGTRATELQRDVNDTAYDVSLHVYFKDQAAHDTYQSHPRHKMFIDEMNANWKSVRVFDSWVVTR
jgi:hypothetical protein